MNLYLDTSALVKLYVREPGTRDVRTQVDRAERVATSRVAYPEARAAFARRFREGGLSRPGLRQAAAALDRDLPGLLIVELDAITARRAGDLAERHALRGFDAIHLASALELTSLLGSVAVFLAYDSTLLAAAAAEGLFPSSAAG
ncbi:MAG: type II toxin-antitoxin system VapC family toxin [Planctomycetes bacterium]|nr:type II toxin-antitoxin system VapC family toxin [Planctomycetota bacterium]